VLVGFFFKRAEYLLNILGKARPEPVEGVGFDKLNQLRHDLLK